MSLISLKGKDLLRSINCWSDLSVVERQLWVLEVKLVKVSQHAVESKLLSCYSLIPDTDHCRIELSTKVREDFDFAFDFSPG